MAHSKEKKSTENVPEKDFIAHILDKDCEWTVLKMLKEQKKEIDKVKEIIYDQNKKRKEYKRHQKEILELKCS